MSHCSVILLSDIKSDWVGSGSVSLIIVYIWWDGPVLACWDCNRRINCGVFFRFIGKCVFPAYRKTYFPTLGPLLCDSSASEFRRRGNHPTEIIQQSEHDESLKSRIRAFAFVDAVVYLQFQLLCNYCKELTEFYLQLFSANYPALENVGTWDLCSDSLNRCGNCWCMHL